MSATADSLFAPQPGVAHWRLNALALIPALMALVGLTIFLYPSAASWTSQYHQSKIVNAYHQQVTVAEPDAAEQLKLARTYNDALVSGAYLDANANIARGTGTSSSILEYESMLRASDTGMMARIRIPKIDVDLPIYHGTSEDSLLRGAGHLQGTSLPVGGIGTRSVITAHRGLADAEMFTYLDELGAGDTFNMEVFGEVLVYKVIDKQVVEPHENEAVAAVSDKDLATLITCTPLGINSHRIIVTGERVLPTPETDQDMQGEPSDLPRFPWFVPVYVVGVVLAGIFVWAMGRPTSPRPMRPQPGPAHVARVTRRHVGTSH